MALDTSFLLIVSEPIRSMWQRIAKWHQSDADEMEQHISNDDAIEACIDADRLISFGFDVVHESIEEAMNMNGYIAVHRFLTKSIALV